MIQGISRIIQTLNVIKNLSYLLVIVHREGPRIDGRRPELRCAKADDGGHDRRTPVNESLDLHYSVQALSDAVHSSAYRKQAVCLKKWGQ